MWILVMKNIYHPKHFSPQTTTTKKPPASYFSVNGDEKPLFLSSLRVVICQCYTYASCWPYSVFFTEGSPWCQSHIGKLQIKSKHKPLRYHVENYLCAVFIWFSIVIIVHHHLYHHVPLLHIQKPCPGTSANLISRICFFWISRWVNLPIIMFQFSFQCFYWLRNNHIT